MFKGTMGNMCAIPSKTYTCNVCQQEENIDDYDSSCKYLPVMAKQEICFKCAFWMDKIANPPPNRVIIGGFHYTIHPFVKRPNNVIKGFAGREFYVRKLDGTLIKSNNVWCQGEIPPQFRDKLPDTANFLSLMTFQKLFNNDYKCHAKGCWDRYHCIRYNLECESDGPFNNVPTNHIVGSENCPSFININELKT